MKRIAALTYGVICYFIFFATFVYTMGFVGNLLVPKSIDSASTGPIGEAILINAVLLGIFAVQHSVMARPAFKRWWTRFVPQPVERSTYVLFSSLALMLLFAYWQPIGGVIWQAQNPGVQAVLNTVCIFGWGLVLVSTLLINHFDLFGLRQVWLYFRGRERHNLAFVTPGMYRFVRHPIYLGFLFAIWATPTMTAAHLLFALLTTAYILIGIRFEEHDLIDLYGVRYSEYRKQVPMLVPRLPETPHDAIQL
jgi:protein-S-isoprenylcysteine O-methyltransferase Ste14